MALTIINVLSVWLNYSQMGPQLDVPHVQLVNSQQQELPNVRLALQDALHAQMQILVKLVVLVMDCFQMHALNVLLSNSRLEVLITALPVPLVSSQLLKQLHALLVQLAVQLVLMPQLVKLALQDSD